MNAVFKRQNGNDSFYAALFTDTQRPAEMPVIKPYSCVFLIVKKTLKDWDSSDVFGWGFFHAYQKISGEIIFVWKYDDNKQFI